MKNLLLLLAGFALLSQFTLPGAVYAADNNSRLGSVGLQVVPTATGELVVLQVPGGTPAFRAGLKPGDLIVQVDNFSLVGSDFAEVISKHLWGVAGSMVTIHYLRPGEAGRKSVNLRRAAADPKLTVTPTVRNNSPAKGEKP